MAMQHRLHNRRGLADRLFLEHPHSLGLSWAEHATGALRIGAELIGAGFAALVHAAVPGIFTQTAGRIVARTYAQMEARRSSAADGLGWPEYEI